MYIEKAKELIRRIHTAGTNKTEWLRLEAEVSEFMATLSKDQFDIVDQLFCDDGAGEILYMACDGIRYEKSNSDKVYRVIAYRKIHQHAVLTLDHDVFEAPNTPLFNQWKIIFS